MFDWIKSSYNLGKHFTNVECQTKDLACSMTRYWISPDGCLYELTYRDTHDFVEIEKNDERYDSERGFLNFEWIPTGKHGKVEPCDVTDYVEIYPSNWNGHWQDWPRCRIHFKCGKIMDYKTFTRND